MSGMGHGSHRRYSKLTPEDVATIRNQANAGVSSEQIAKEQGVSATQIRNIIRGDQWSTVSGITWPIPGVWLGTSIEDQATADERIPHLLKCPAAVRFISAEPLLENVTLLFDRDRRKIDWVIAGGESGPEARPCEIEWLRHIRIQCYAHATPLFIKQLGSRPFDAKMRANVPPEGSNGWPPGTRFRTDVDAMAIWQCSGHAKLRDAKGGEPSEWPEDLRVREFPR